MFVNKVFRFRQFNQYSLAELNNRTLWFSSVKDFNDPFEFLYSLDLSLPKDELQLREWLLYSSQTEAEKGFINQADVATLERLAKSSVENLANGYVKTLSCKSGTKICCVSKEYKDPLMWSHYTNGMTGFAIVYNSFDTIDGETFPALPVRYVKTPPVVDVDCLNLASSLDGYELNTRLIASKHERWAYEQEMRFICCPEHPNEFLRRIKLRDGGIMDLPDYAIHGVICGHKMSSDNLNVIKAICRHNNYKLYRADIHTEQYDVVVSEIVS
ncbi:DUF2971 domain-containing protein [Vibrio parahaemolyticus]